MQWGEVGMWRFHVTNQRVTGRWPTRLAFHLDFMYDVFHVVKVYHIGTG